MVTSSLRPSSRPYGIRLIGSVMMPAAVNLLSISMRNAATLSNAVLRPNLCTGSA